MLLFCLFWKAYVHTHLAGLNSEFQMTKGMPVVMVQVYFSYIHDHLHQQVQKRPFEDVDLQCVWQVIWFLPVGRRRKWKVYLS